MGKPIIIGALVLYLFSRTPFQWLNDNPSSFRKLSECPSRALLHTWGFYGPVCTALAEQFARDRPLGLSCHNLAAMIFGICAVLRDLADRVTGSPAARHST